MIKNKTYRVAFQFGSMIVGVFLLSALLSLLFSGFTWFSSFENLIHRTAYGSTLGIFYGAGNWIIGTYTGTRLNWRENLTRATLISLLSFIIWGIVVSIATPYYFAKYVWQLSGDSFRYSVLLNAFIGISVDMIIISIYYSLYLVYYWKKSIEGYEQLKRDSITAQYNALKNQVNPHFLFNSLNTLSGIVEKDQKNAVLFIKKLSGIYRYVLEQHSKELVKIEEELNFISDYIFLLKIRHGEGLRFINSVSPDPYYIVPLGLQLIIENCIKHNIISDDMPLEIRLQKEENYLVIRNNLQRKTSILNKDSQGLDNLKNRYSYLTDMPLLISENESEFVVKIPVINSPQE